MSDERIVAAALRKDGMIYSMPIPNRHHNIFYQVAKTHGEPLAHQDQGFLTSRGLFVDRERARQIAVKSKQLMGEGHSPQELFSEDLW